MKLKDLKPSTRVMVEFGAITAKNEETGESITVDAKKTIDVPYAYYKSVTESKDDFVEKTDYYKPIGRTVKLLGTTEYETVTGEDGMPVTVPKAVSFDK